MTTIHLVRHAQASFGSAVYDRLSDKGICQARAVGTYLARLDGGVSAAASGCLRRQIDTARHALAALDRPLHIATTSAFNEYPIDNLLKAYLPVIAARNGHIAEAREHIHRDKRLYMAALSELARLWADGADGPVVETWASFRARVDHGLKASLRSRGKRETVAIFTSGGVIATIVGEILGLSPERTFSLNWRMHNASVTEIHYGKSGFALGSFNSVGHLRLACSSELITYW